MVQQLNQTLNFFVSKVPNRLLELIWALVTVTSWLAALDASSCLVSRYLWLYSYRRNKMKTTMTTKVETCRKITRTRKGENRVVFFIDSLEAKEFWSIVATTEG